MRNKLLIIAVMASLALLAAACGGDDPTATPTATSTAPPASGDAMDGDAMDGDAMDDDAMDGDAMDEDAMDGNAMDEGAMDGEAQGSDELASDIANFALQGLTVSVGTTVTWTNRGSVPHTATAGTPGNLSGVWDSSTLSRGEPFSFTFTEAGTFAYFCTIHPSMQATVTVTE